MIWTPYPPNTVINALDRLVRPPQLFAVRIPQQLRLPEHLHRLHVGHAHGFVSPVDVVADYDGVLARSGGYGDFDFGVLRCEFCEVGSDEAAVQCATLATIELGQGPIPDITIWKEGALLHSL